MGYSPQISALLNAPSGVVSVAAALVAGYGIRYASHRWAWIIAVLIPGIIGGALMSFVPIHNRSGVLAGIYLVNSVTASLPIIYHWTACNVAGQTKRAFSVAIVSGSFSIGNILGPQTFQARDAPEYRPAKIAILACLSAGAVVGFVLFLLYRHANAKGGRGGVIARQDCPGDDGHLWENLTDKKNAAFCYVY